jgi:ribosomal protein S18 acetylase RimI-like enzyme
VEEKRGMLEIRKAKDEDKAAVWDIIKAVIAGGDTYVFAPDTPEDEMLEYWLSPEKHTYVAVWDEPDAEPEIVGTFFLRPNYPGLGAHVGNAGYMVKPGQYGKGIGREMAEWSLEESRRLGYTAMQFNFVVKSNENAVKLWKSIGMEIIGEIPDAFDHAEHGLTNAYIMYRKL